jgi:ribosomal-protein-serine acetyltransferase
VIPLRTSLRRAPLETARTLLVPIDAPDGQELWEAVDGSRWHLERWLPWVPYNNNPEASVRYAEACAVDWDAGRALRFAVRDKNSRHLLGVVGLDACVHLHRSCELGYWLRRDAVGRGLMTESASAGVEFGFARVGLHRIRCAAATDNVPSAAPAEPSSSAILCSFSTTISSARASGRPCFLLASAATSAQILGTSSWP